MANVRLLVTVDSKGAVKGIEQFTGTLDAAGKKSDAVKGKLSGIFEGDLSGKAGTLSSRMGVLGEAAAALGPAGMGAAAGFVATAGAAYKAAEALTSAAMAAGAYADSVRNTAETFGMSNSNFQELTERLAAANVEIGTATAATQKLGDILSTSPQMFEALGLDPAALRAMDPSDMLLRVVGTIKNLDDQASKSAAVNDFLGKANAGLLRVDTSANQAAASVGRMWSDEQINKSADFQGEVERMERAWSGLWASIGTSITDSDQLVGALESIALALGKVSNWFLQNGPWIGQQIDELLNKGYRVGAFFEGGGILSPVTAFAAARAEGQRQQGEAAMMDIGAQVIARLRGAGGGGAKNAYRGASAFGGSASAAAEKDLLKSIRERNAAIEAADRASSEAKKKRLAEELKLRETLAAMLRQEAQLHNEVLAQVERERVAYQVDQSFARQFGRGAAMTPEQQGRAELAAAAEEEKTKARGDIAAAAEAAGMSAEQWTLKYKQAGDTVVSLGIRAQAQLAQAAEWGKVGVEALADSAKAALKSLPGSIMGALQGGGDVGKSAGAGVGNAFGAGLEKTATKALTGVLGKTLGSALGSAVPVLGTIAGGMLGGAIGGLIAGKSGGQKAAEDLARIVGGDMKYTEDQGKAIDDQAKSLGIGRAQAVLLNLGTLAREAGAPMSDFLGETISLFDAVALKAVPAKEGIAALEQQWAALAEEGAFAENAEYIDRLFQAMRDGSIDAATGTEMLGEAFNSLAEAAEDGSAAARSEMLALIRDAKAAGEEVAAIGDYIAEQFSTAGEDLSKILAQGFVSGSQAGDLFSANFEALKNSEGMLAAIEEMGPAFAALDESARASLGEVAELMKLSSDEARPILEAGAALSRQIGALGSTDTLTRGSFDALQAGLLAERSQLEAAGVSPEAALLAIGEDLARLQSAADEYGFAMSDGIAQAIEEARAAGVGFSEDPVVELEATLAESVVPALESLTSALEYLGGNVPLHGEGGYFDKPHLAIVGDRPEWIVPQADMVSGAQVSGRMAPGQSIDPKVLKDALLAAILESGLGNFKLMVDRNVLGEVSVDGIIGNGRAGEKLTAFMETGVRR